MIQKPDKLTDEQWAALIKMLYPSQKQPKQPQQPQQPSQGN